VAEQCLKAGVHVFLEKPMALSTAECDRLIELARDNGLRLGVNHNALHHPLYRRLVRDLAEWKLGKVQHVLSVNSVMLSQLTAGLHDHWMFRTPENILFEQGPHPMSQICDLLGRVREVTTVSSGEQLLRGGTVFRSVWQISTTCDGGTAQIFMAFGRAFPEAWLHVIGQDGAAHIDLLNSVYVLDRRTKYADPLDAFLRCLDHARQVASGGVRALGRYARSTLRLSERSDAFYVSMHGSIRAFYASLSAEDPDDGSARLGRLVVEGLEKAAGTRPASSNRRPSPPAGTGSRRQGEVLVLGGTGFIGRRLVPALAAAGYPVRLLVRRPSGIPETLKGYDLHVLPGDIRSMADVDAAVEGCRAVIHLVSGEPSSWPEFEKLFVDGTRNVAEACLRWKVRQLLFASSIAVYYTGRRGVTISEETPLDRYPERRSPYARAKIACERLLTDLHRSRGLPVTIFRPGIVVGAGGLLEHSGAGFWPSSTHCITWGSANGGLPFVLVDDVALAMVSALGMAGLEGTSFNLVGDVRPSATEYIAELRAHSRRDIRIHPQSISKWMTSEILKWAAKAVAAKPENSFPQLRDLASRALASEFDCARAKHVLGWKPVSERERFIELGIRRALNGGAE
jgi:nucleoside-diphosphate-sugar epimerase/predicted dehydrogenase